jgi:enoyl-CoA hydratase/carnithine racemase
LACFGKSRLSFFFFFLFDFKNSIKYGSPLATVAAIDGHAPAGGCLLSASCDERVMASGNFGIGLNETQLGIVAPFW